MWLWIFLSGTLWYFWYISLQRKQPSKKNQLNKNPPQKTKWNQLSYTDCFRLFKMHALQVFTATSGVKNNAVF